MILERVMILVVVVVAMGYHLWLQVMFKRVDDRLASLQGNLEVVQCDLWVLASRIGDLQLRVKRLEARAGIPDDDDVDEERLRTPYKEHGNPLS